jgi:hypothetical protein
VGKGDWKILRVNEKYIQKAWGSYNIRAYTSVIAKGGGAIKYVH